jgi:hypothetical protein
MLFENLLAIIIIFEEISKVALSTWIAIGALAVSLFTFLYGVRFKRKVIRLEKESIWFRHIVVEPHFKDIEGFYERSENLLLMNKDFLNNMLDAGEKINEKHVGPVLQAFETLRSTFGADFLDIVSAVQPDCSKKLDGVLDNLGVELRRHFEGFIGAEKAIRNNHIMNLLAKSKIEFIRVLYEHETMYLAKHL